MSDVYRGTQPSDAFLIVALGGEVVAVDRQTGKLIWKNGLPSGGHGAVSLLIEPDTVYASAYGATVFCLARATGHEVWRASTSASGRATLVHDRGQLFVAKGGYLDCYSSTGEKLWSNGLAGLGGGPIAMGFIGNVVQADSVGT